VFQRKTQQCRRASSGARKRERQKETEGEIDIENAFRRSKCCFVKHRWSVDKSSLMQLYVIHRKRSFFIPPKNILFSSIVLTGFMQV